MSSKTGNNIIPTFIAMVAMDEARVIGTTNGMPRRNAEDYRLFQQTIRYHHCILGRKTWESIPNPSPSQKTYHVLSTSPKPHSANGNRYQNIYDLLAALPDTGPIFVLGGQIVYEQFLTRNLIDVMYVSHIPGIHEGSVTMPIFENKFSHIQRVPYDTFSLSVYEKMG